MLKKGQVAIFFIVGIFLLAGFFLYSITDPDSIPKSAQASQTLDITKRGLNVKSFVESCLEQTAEEALYFVGLQGGYNEPIPNSVQYSFFTVPFYLNKDTITLPRIQTIETGISNYLEDNLAVCINNFENLKDAGISVVGSEITASTTIQENTVLTSLVYPLTIQNGLRTQRMDSFSAEINFDFREIFNIIEEIMLEQQKDVASIPVGFLIESAEKNDFTFDLIYEDSEKVIISLLFEDFKIKDESYIYNYAANYDWDAIPQSRSDIEINPVPELKAQVGTPFSHTVSASSEKVTFSDYTELFDIKTFTGEIRFIPQEEDLGKHSVMVETRDIHGNTDAIFVDIEVVQGG